jgi:hypothetical protein
LIIPVLLVCPTCRAVSGPLTGDWSKARGAEGAPACVDASALDAASELPARAKGDGGGLEGGQSAAYGVGEVGGMPRGGVGGMPRGGVGVPLVPLRKGKIGSHVSDALVFSHGVARELEARAEVLFCPLSLLFAGRRERRQRLPGVTRPLVVPTLNCMPIAAMHMDALAPNTWALAFWCMCIGTG